MTSNLEKAANTKSQSSIKKNHSAVTKNRHSFNLDYAEKRAVFRYRSPVSGSITIIIFPSFSLLLEIDKAAFIAAPDEIPANIPSSLTRRRANVIASSFSTGTISSMRL